MPVTTFTKKVEVVTAIEYDGTNHEEIISFCPDVQWNEDTQTLYFYALIVHQGEWIAKDVVGVYSLQSHFLTYYKPGGGP